MAWRPAAELLGFVKDALITLAVLFGVQQVVLARRSLKEEQQRNLDEHERASKTVAVEYAARFTASFGPKYIAFINEVVRAGLSPYRGPVGDFTFLSIPSQLRNAAVQRSRLPSSSGALDELEVFAAAHTTGVADEETGFRLNGRMFCLIAAQDFYDLLCIEQEQGYYLSIVELYRLWSPRLERQKLTRSKELLDLQKAAIEKDIESRKAELEAQKTAIDKQLQELPESEKRRPIGIR